MEQEILDDVQSTEQSDVKWAGFWIRFGAAFIDGLTYLPFIGLSFYNLYNLKSLPVQIFIDLIFILYKPIMEYKYGATLGKIAVKITVVSENFEKISGTQAILRNYPHWLSQLVSMSTAFLLFNHPGFENADSMTSVGAIQNDVISPFISSGISFACFISLLVVAFTGKKQGLHDMVAKTYCVYK